MKRGSKKTEEEKKIEETKRRRGERRRRWGWGDLRDVGFFSCSSGLFTQLPALNRDQTDKKNRKGVSPRLQEELTLETCLNLTTCLSYVGLNMLIDQSCRADLN